jgi:hypothetical protein
MIPPKRRTTTILYYFIIVVAVVNVKMLKACKVVETGAFIL